MSAATVTLTDDIRSAATAAAREEGVSLDAFVSDVVANYLREAGQIKELKVRAARADYAKFRATLANVPDAPPVPGDDLPR